MLLTRSTTCPRRVLSSARAGVVFGQHVLEGRIVPLDGGHGVVNELAYGALARLRLQVGPACLGWHPEDALGSVLVWVFGVRTLATFTFQPGVALLEGVGDVFQEDEAEDDVLVLGGVHAAPQHVGRAPKLGLVDLAVHRVYLLRQPRACRGSAGKG